MKHDDEWKEFWRKNSPTYQKNKRRKRNKILLISLGIIMLSVLIGFVIIKKPNIDILDNSKYADNGSIEFKDHLFISAIEEISELYDEDTLDYNKIDKAIDKISLLSVSSIFNELYIYTIEELEHINPINNTYGDIENKNNYITFSNEFFDKLETVMLGNNKEYTRTNKGIEYTYSVTY